MTTQKFPPFNATLTDTEFSYNEITKKIIEISDIQEKRFHGPIRLVVYKIIKLMHI